MVTFIEEILHGKLHFLRSRSLWEKINTQYLHGIASAVRTYKIPDELILNPDQALSKYLPTTSVIMAEKRTARIPVRKGGWGEGGDKRSITVTVIQGLSGKMLPSQIIYTGKTEINLPKNDKGKENFLFSYNEKYLSNEV